MCEWLYSSTSEMPALKKVTCKACEYRYLKLLGFSKPMGWVLGQGFLGSYSLKEH